MTANERKIGCERINFAPFASFAECETCEEAKVRGGKIKRNWGKSAFEDWDLKIIKSVHSQK